MKYAFHRHGVMTAPEAHGRHVYLDYSCFHPQVESPGDWLLDVMLEASRTAGVRIVHSHVENFDGKVSPLGFAAVVLIDESHVSAHCYSEQGWLAIDAFTCGEHDPDVIVDIIDSAIKEQSPDVVLMKRQEVERFLHE